MKPKNRLVINLKVKMIEANQEVWILKAMLMLNKALSKLNGNEIQIK
jgi:hypothetical protein